METREVEWVSEWGDGWQGWAVSRPLMGRHSLQGGGEGSGSQQREWGCLVRGSKGKAQRRGFCGGGGCNIRRGGGAPMRPEFMG